MAVVVVLVAFPAEGDQVQPYVELAAAARAFGEEVGGLVGLRLLAPLARLLPELVEQVRVEDLHLRLPAFDGFKKLIRIQRPILFRCQFQQLEIRGHYLFIVATEHAIPATRK